MLLLVVFSDAHRYVFRPTEIYSFWLHFDSLMMDKFSKQFDKLSVLTAGIMPDHLAYLN